MIFSFIIRLTFGAFPNKAEVISVFNNDAHVTYKSMFGECNTNLKPTESLSCLFVREYLAKKFQIVSVKLIHSHTYYVYCVI